MCASWASVGWAHIERGSFNSVQFSSAQFGLVWLSVWITTKLKQRLPFGVGPSFCCSLVCFLWLWFVPFAFPLAILFMNGQHDSEYHVVPGRLQSQLDNCRTIGSL